MQLKSFADNGQGVSTLERDELTLMLNNLLGRPTEKFELVVFKAGILQVEGLGASDEDIVPLHVEYSNTLEEAENAHQRVLNGINTGTLTYNPPRTAGKSAYEGMDEYSWYDEEDDDSF